MNEALSVLRFTKKRAAKDLLKLLKTAVANAESMPDTQVDVDNPGGEVHHGGRRLAEVPAADASGPHGPGVPLRRRQSHIAIGLEEKK